MRSLTDRLDAWLARARAGEDPGVLEADLEAIEMDVRNTLADLEEASPLAGHAGPVERILREAWNEAGERYLAVVESGYGFVDTGEVACLEAAARELGEAFSAMNRFEALLDQAQQRPGAPREFGTG